MRVKLKTRMSGPGGSYDPGTVVDLPNGEDLIWGGFPEAVDVGETPKPSLEESETEALPGLADPPPPFISAPKPKAKKKEKA